MPRSRIYLDTSAMKRPFDDQGSSRVQAETHAMLAILDAIEAGRLDLIGSDVLVFENERNPNRERRDRTTHYLGLATDEAPGLSDPATLARAGQIEALGFRALDAAHLAAAERAAAMAFVTCDDRLLRTARRRRSMLAIRVASPIEFLADEAGP